MKVVLCFPPSWTATMPHLALPMLTGYLRAQGIQVEQRDLNLELKDQMLTRAHLERSVQRLRQRTWRAERPDAAALQWALADGVQVAARIEDAKRVIRSDEFYDGPRGQWALETILSGLQLASLPFHPATLDLSSFNLGATEYSSQSLLSVVRDPALNPFRELFQEGIIAEWRRDPPDLVGISIPTTAQFLAGMTLASLIKEAGLPTHVTVGGPHISVLREGLPQAPALFEIIDSAVVFAGELPLLRLAEALADRRDLSGVPNLIYRDEGKIVVNARAPGVKLADQPPPDFRGLPLERYLAPGLVLPLITSRGCYHGKCAFCNVGYGEGAQFEQIPGELAVAQMLHLKERYPVKHIWFADEAISPRNLRAMSAELEKMGAPIEWSAYLRFDRAIQRDLLDGLYRAGCRMLFFGLESASPKVMQAMNKGIELPIVRRILRDSAEAGLWNHLFFFFGFPGETIEDAQQTVNFFYEQSPHVHSTGFGAFVLELYAAAYQHPQRFGISRIKRDPKQDLAICFNYQVSRGMDEQMTELAASRFLDALPRKEFGHFYIHDVYRILYAQHLQHQGSPYPPWLE